MSASARPRSHRSGAPSRTICAPSPGGRAPAAAPRPVALGGGAGYHRAQPRDCRSDSPESPLAAWLTCLRGARCPAPRRLGSHPPGRQPLVRWSPGLEKTLVTDQGGCYDYCRPDHHHQLPLYPRASTMPVPGVWNRRYATLRNVKARMGSRSRVCSATTERSPASTSTSHVHSRMIPH